MPSTSLLDFVIALKQTNPQLAQAPTAAGLTRHFIAFLGSPAWAVKGTRFSAGTPIPSTITMAEDLRLLANLEARLGLPEMLRQMTEWPHTFAETFFLNAPDLRSALAVLAANVDRSNDHLKISAGQQAKGMVLTLQPDIRIGPFRTLIMLIALAFLHRLVTRFCGSAAGSQLEVTTDDPGLPDLLRPLALRVRCNPASGGEESTVLVPASLLDTVSPGHLPTVWQHIMLEESLARLRNVSLDQLDEASVTELFSVTLESKQRLPQHAEIARMLRVSERTLARRLSHAGISLREMGEAARRARAKQLLADPRLSVGTVSLQLGYRDPAGFSRAFKAWTGQAPREWRASAAGRDEGLQEQGMRDRGIRDGGRA